MPVSFAQKRNKTFLDEKETPLEFLNSDIHPACNSPERKRKYIYIEREGERGGKVRLASTIAIFHDPWT